MVRDEETAERLARQRGTSVGEIRDYRELATLYEEAARLTNSRRQQGA